MFLQGCLVTLVLMVFRETLARLDGQVLQDHVGGFALHARAVRQVLYNDL